MRQMIVERVIRIYLTTLFMFMGHEVEPEGRAGHNYISWTILLHVNEEDRKNLEKRSARLKAFCKKATSEAYAYHRIFPLEKGIKKNLGITATFQVILSSEWTV